jgi:hypothetical protein
VSFRLSPTWASKQNNVKELTMAKSKTRRVRRSQPEKQSQPIAAGQPAAANEEALTPPAADASRGPGRKTVDFGQEYYYVYRELRVILLVAVAMFAIMTGLAYLI